jgi:hypothetical protein
MKWKSKEENRKLYGVDVLAQNSFGRSALTDAFDAQTQDLLQMILEHQSASEDKLLPEGMDTQAIDEADGEGPKDAEGSKIVQAKVHQIVLGHQAAHSPGILCREVGLSWMGDALVDTDANKDTTGVVRHLVAPTITSSLAFVLSIFSYDKSPSRVHPGYFFELAPLFLITHHHRYCGRRR